jgi:regulatory protein
MIIKEIIKNKNDYNLILDDEEILVDENTIVKYNLYINKEIDDNLLKEIYNSYYYEKKYNMAINYYVKYNKSKKGLYYYLINKDVESNIAQRICDELEEKNIINDLLLAKNYTLSLISKSYGYYMIIKKLKDLFVSDEVIEEVINNYDYDDYIFYMNKFVKKNESKYTKYSDNVRKYKMFDDLKKRGYTTSDISNLNIK